MNYFDGHCDTILRSFVDGRSLRANGGHLDLERLSRFDRAAQFFAIFADKQEIGGLTMPDCFHQMYDIFKRELAANADLAVHCRTAEEARSAWADGKVAAFLSGEGSELLGCSLEGLEEAYRLGVRAVNLTWNYENPLSGSNAEGADKGLTPLGRQFVRRMQELGMLVDVSHLSDPGFWDVMELATKPIFASHSDSRAVCGHKRNLTDAQFTAIISNHGVAGINMCVDFLGEDPDISTVVAHIDHWMALGGEKNISLGGDWDGIARTPGGIWGVEDIGRVAEELLRLNYKEEQVDDLCLNNLMRVVSEVCTM